MDKSNELNQNKINELEKKQQGIYSNKIKINFLNITNYN
jgi:hypothetical protein